MEYTVTILESNDGFCEARCPQLGIFASAVTLEEALHKMKDMILLVASRDINPDAEELVETSQRLIMEHSRKIH